MKRITITVLMSEAALGYLDRYAKADYKIDAPTFLHNLVLNELSDVVRSDDTPKITTQLEDTHDHGSSKVVTNY